MTLKKSHAHLSLVCQNAAKKKLAELVEMPIRGIKKLIIISIGSNGLTHLLKHFRTQILLKRKLGDQVMYFDRNKINYYNNSPAELLEQMFHLCNPKVIIIDDFQLYFEHSIFWKKIVDLIAKTKKKNVLIVAGMNEERLYEKESIIKINSEFDTIATITKPSTNDIIDLSESILTDYNPVNDLTQNLGLDLKNLLVEIERKSGYPGNINTEEKSFLTTKI